MSHDDHKDPAINGYTITGIFRGKLVCFLVYLSILSQVCKALS